MWTLGLRGLLTALAQGRGGVSVIEGPPGIGKNRLLTEVMALADKAGGRTLFGEAFEYQQTVRFSRCSRPPCAPIPRLATPTRCAGWAARADLRYWVVLDLHDAIHAAAAAETRWPLCWRTPTGPMTARCWRCGRWPARFRMCRCCGC